MNSSVSPNRLSVSVALATYNGGRFLRAQLDSIAGQTMLPDELVITDDQSTDNTVRIIEDFAALAPFPVRLYRNSARLGYALNFRAASSNCQGDLIFFCDQDDTWLNDKIEVMLAAFADPKVLLAYHGATIVDEYNVGELPFYIRELEEKRLATQPMPPWHSPNGLTQVFRSTLRAYDDLWNECANHGWAEGEIVAHDQWYFFLAQVLGTVVFVDKGLVRYRQHGQNVFGALPDSERLSLLGRWIGRLTHRPLSDAIRVRAAESRAAILFQLAHRLPPSEAERATIIGYAYCDLAVHLRQRYRVYNGNSIASRLLALTAAVRFGAYAGGAWRFHPGSVARDVFGGVLGWGALRAD